ncbi:hypothetical protein NWP22_09970 [Anabaenopsis tanganyikae CS-531]|uniref:Uncharacterized protein n=2 Tax=Anabaenopsis TaxID=110103 RepID=A0ABT5AU91_9CYAN|nr:MULTISPECIES: hypothetical protein [Anabaenopsis]MDB9540886.1 hypothetical protein [Anabaenopsis arnoldii]MDH6093324.1 hypothetical protein [Anabaenopsis arnoldii]MDH6106188.1 hypothetical protein [Anabaenopsis tanganyikae CS-531]
MIPVYEFSKGIELEKNPNGGWVSLGFTGKYINATLDPIPPVVERSIANQEFATIGGASDEQPAIIGRVVGTGEETWSVMAVVTQARDEGGYKFSFYRYFFTPGASNLGCLIAWWESQGKPTFNPFDSKYVGEYAYFDPALAGSSDYDPTPNDLELVTTKPTLLHPQQYNLTNVNTLAIGKHNLDQTQPISWAFNVEALVKPHSFQIIQPASLEACEILARQIIETASTKKAIKAAIQSLINISQVEPPAVETIIDTLENQQLNTEEWYSLFDAEGATTAMSEKIHSSSSVRLITLRAMVIPETLPEFLKWLNIQPGKQPSEYHNTSLQFQGAIGDYFPQEQLAKGIKLLLPKLLQKHISPESINWLLLKGGAWAVFRHRFINDVRYDLELIHQQSDTDAKQFDNLNFPQKIWQELIMCREFVIYDSYKLSYYKPLAQLFELLQEYDLSAYFYQVSDAIVSKKVFLGACPNRSNESYSPTILGLTFKRKISPVETIIRLVKFKSKNEILLPVLVLLAFITLGWLRREHRMFFNYNLEDVRKVLNNSIKRIF